MTADTNCISQLDDLYFILHYSIWFMIEIPSQQTKQDQTATASFASNNEKNKV